MSTTPHLHDVQAFELYVVVWLLYPLEKIGGELPAALEVSVCHLRNFSVQIARGRRVIAGGSPRHKRPVHVVLSTCFEL